MNHTASSMDTTHSPCDITLLVFLGRDFLEDSDGSLTMISFATEKRSLREDGLSQLFSHERFRNDCMTFNLISFC